MEDLILTPEVVKSLIFGQKYYNQGRCISLAHKLAVHAKGECPTDLIAERRPSEPEEIKDYRQKIYVAKTKNPVFKVTNSLEKIRRSQDWSIQYDPKAIPAAIAHGESLEDYCEFNYPAFTSITNWAFAELLRMSLIDANGFIVVMPEFAPADPSQYVKPIAKFVESFQIINYHEGDYLVFKSRDTCEYRTSSGKSIKTDGAIYYIITKTQVAKYEQISQKGDIQQVQIIDHNIGQLPAWKVGGLYLDRVNNDTIFESRIACMIPSLDEAAREYSDLQAEIVQHIHSEKYAYTNTECPECHGRGEIVELDSNGQPKKDANGKPIKHTCQRCGGHGSVLNTSPYGVHLIDAAKAGELQLPAPPIGYIQKSADIARLQDERVRQHIYDALSSVNMEFLAEVPLSQSGVAKQVDRSELNNFVNSIAEDLVRNLDLVYFFINEYRYGYIISDAEKRKAMLPHVNVPVKYDILDSSTLLNELGVAHTQKVNPLIIKHMEIDYAKKQFNCNPEVAKAVETTFSLDPLFGIDEDNKMAMLQNGGITKQDYIISCNIQAFVKRAMEEHPDFSSMESKKQMEILRKYAEEIQKANEAEKKAASPIMEAPEENPTEKPEEAADPTETEEENSEE